MNLIVSLAGIPIPNPPEGGPPPPPPCGKDGGPGGGIGGQLGPCFPQEELEVAMEVDSVLGVLEEECWSLLV